MITSIAASPAAAPAPHKVTATKVSDIPFDFGDEYYNTPDGELASRPATKGLLSLNLKTLQAAQDKIQAIKNRAEELDQTGVQKKDAAGNLHYANAETGETVNVETSGDKKVYEQTFTTHEKHWFSNTTAIHGERFECHGDEVDVSVHDNSDKVGKVLMIPVTRHDGSDMTMSFKYALSPEGLKFWHSDEWHIAK